MNKYITRTTQVTIVPEGEPIFSEMATEISIDDEAAGEFIALRQPSREDGKVAIDIEEWPHIKNAVDMMMKEITEKKEGK